MAVKKLSDLPQKISSDNGDGFVITSVTGQDMRVPFQNLRENLGVVALEDGAISTTHPYETKSAMDSDDSIQQSSVGHVSNDPDPDNNGFYIYDGDAWNPAVMFLEKVTNDTNKAKNDAVDAAGLATNAANAANNVAESVGTLDSELRDIKTGFNATLTVKSVQNNSITVFATQVQDIMESRTIAGITYNFPAARISYNY